MGREHRHQAKRVPCIAVLPQGLEAIGAEELSALGAKEVKPLRAHDTLLDLLEEVVERHDLAPALLRAHEEGFSRISYRSHSNQQSHSRSHNSIQVDNVF